MSKFLASILTVMAVTSSSAFAGDLRVADGRFVDSRGATVVLRGFNLSQLHKLPPFRANSDPLLFEKLTASGVNVIRHQFNWEAYEQSPNVYDESYLDYYANIVDRAAAAGVYVIIDIHQDAFSRWTLDGCGEGFPKWAIPQGTKLSEPDNGSKCWFWPLRVMANRSSIEAIFNKFYAEDYMPRERYMLLLEKLATRFAGYRNVIGYDLLNEPQGDATLLRQFYIDGIARVRRHDPQAIAFIEPEMLTASGLESTKLTNPMFG
jgi:endoglycosylceramidase